jgi:hypothetical protein
MDVITAVVVVAVLLALALFGYAVNGLREGNWTEERRILAAEARKRRELRALERMTRHARH